MGYRRSGNNATALGWEPFRKWMGTVREHGTAPLAVGEGGRRWSVTATQWSVPVRVDWFLSGLGARPLGRGGAVVLRHP